MAAAFSVSRVTTYIRIILKTCKVCQVMITHHSHCFGTVTFGRIPLQSLSLRYFLRMSLQICGLRKIYGCDKVLNISNILINQYVDWCCCKSGRVLYFTTGLVYRELLVYTLPDIFEYVYRNKSIRKIFR